MGGLFGRHAGVPFVFPGSSKFGHLGLQLLQISTETADVPLVVVLLAFEFPRVPGFETFDLGVGLSYRLAPLVADDYQDDQDDANGAELRKRRYSGFQLGPRAQEFVVRTTGVSVVPWPFVGRLPKGPRCSRS